MKQSAFRESHLYNAISLTDSIFLGRKFVALNYIPCGGCPKSNLIGVYRLSDGSLYCTFDKTDFTFLRTSSLSQKLSPFASKILDKKTNKIYDITFKTLLHLGAKQTTLFSKDLK